VTRVLPRVPFSLVYSSLLASSTSFLPPLWATGTYRLVPRGYLEVQQHSSLCLAHIDSSPQLFCPFRCQRRPSCRGSYHFPLPPPPLALCSAPHYRSFPPRWPFLPLLAHIWQGSFSRNPQLLSMNKVSLCYNCFIRSTYRMTHEGNPRKVIEISGHNPSDLGTFRTFRLSSFFRYVIYCIRLGCYDARHR